MYFESVLGGRPTPSQVLVNLESIDVRQTNFDTFFFFFLKHIPYSTEPLITVWKKFVIQKVKTIAKETLHNLAARLCPC